MVQILLAVWVVLASSSLFVATLRINALESEVAQNRRHIISLQQAVGT